MRTRLLFLSLVVLGCGNTVVVGSDDLSHAEDLAANNDLTVEHDLAVSDDLSVVTDLGSETEDLFTGDLAPSPTPQPVTICHATTPGHATLLAVSPDEVAAHVGHGDPFGVANATVYVGAAGTGGLGTESAPFGRATDALALERCRYRATGETGDIRFSAGAHPLSYDSGVLAANPSFEPGPVIIDFPVRLHGATQVSLDDSGRPLPDYTLYDATNSTIIAADAALGPADTQVIFLIADTSGVTVEGFVVSSGHCHIAALCPGKPTVADRGGVGFLPVRADNLTLRNNIIQPGFFSGVDSRGSTVSVHTTYASDTENCVACISGPGRVEVVDNRLDNGLGGVFAAPALGNVPFSLGTQAAAFTVPQVSPSPDPTLDIDVENNVLSGHTRSNTAFGVRLAVYGKDSASTVTRQVLTAQVRNNRIADDLGGNGATQGVLIDAGFPDRLATGTLAGTLFADVSGNTITVPNPKLTVLTMRAQALLNPAPANWKTFAPLDRATIVVDSDVTYPDDFRVDHFATDPLAGQTKGSGNSCSVDNDCSSAFYRTVHLPGSCVSGACVCLPGFTDDTGVCNGPALSNVVVINGAVIPPGTAIP